MGDHGVVANKRGRQTVWDMVLSMAAIGVVVAVIYVFVPHDGNHDPVRTVSYTVELDQARRDAPFKVAGPVGLAKGWRASSVTYNSADPKNVQWHLGFVDPQNQYAAVEQSNAPAATFIAQKSHDARRNEVRRPGARGERGHHDRHRHVLARPAHAACRRARGARRQVGPGAGAVRRW
jgi:hypothetical protein